MPFRNFAPAPIALIFVLASLSGCAGLLPPGAGEATPQPLSPKALPGEAPIVVISFTLDGQEHTVTGHPDRNFCDTHGSYSFTTFEPQGDSGVSFTYEGDGNTSAHAWVAGEYAAQFMGRGSLTMSQAEDGTRTFAMPELKGTAVVVPSDPDSETRVSETDLTKGTFIEEATAAFVLTCPASDNH